MRNLFKEKQDKKKKEEERVKEDIVFPEAPKEIQNKANPEGEIRIITENDLIRQQLDGIIHNQVILLNALVVFAKKSLDIDLEEELKKTEKD